MRIPGLDNHAMGTIFEELIRRFNEDNNEEAGEHFTPRDVVKLMANLGSTLGVHRSGSAARRELGGLEERVGAELPVVFAILFTPAARGGSERTGASLS
jgi:hypothetical protein